MYSNHYQASHQDQASHKPTNYLNLIKGGGRTGGVTSRSPNKLRFNEHGGPQKNINEKENQNHNHNHSKKQDKTKSSFLSSQTYESVHKKNESRLSSDSNSLNDFEIKYLTNTRQKLQSRENVLELKNQMSPVYYNRDAERFSYLQYEDPLIGNQFTQYNNTNINHVNNPSYINYEQSNYHRQQNDYGNKYLPVPQAVSHLYNNYKEYPQNQRKDISALNDYIQQNRLPQSQNTSWSSIRQNNNNPSFLSDQSEYITEKREDSFGNVEFVRRRIEQPTKQSKYVTPNLPQPPKPVDADLMKYTRSDRNTPVSTAYDDDSNKLKEFFNKQLANVNFVKIIFLILVFYVATKNIMKIMNGESFLGSLTTSFNPFNKQANKPQTQQQQPSSQFNQNIHFTDDDFNNSKQNHSQGLGIESLKDKEDIRRNMDATIAKKFAKDLEIELQGLLRKKGKIYCADYEETLINRFANQILREILPEFNKLLLNSRTIRIQYDLMTRTEYYELNPTY